MWLCVSSLTLRSCKDDSTGGVVGKLNWALFGNRGGIMLVHYPLYMPTE